MERWQSRYENAVAYNLSESGVHPLTAAEIGASAEELLHRRLGYCQSNGSERFRFLASSFYANATERNILATIGGVEANFLAVSRLVQPGDEAVLILPNYMQVHGLVESLGGRVVPVWLSPAEQWLPDPDEIAGKLTSKTKVISLSNPNNPSGAVIGLDRIKAIARAADRCGCWILADEVYQGAERIGDRTPSFWSQYPRTLVTQSLSKAYGAPGTRTGWLVGPDEMIEELWAFADYVKISPPMLSDDIACRILETREKVLERTHSILNKNWSMLAAWLNERRSMLEYIAPSAGAICMVKYRHQINSTLLAEQLRLQESTLIVPGDQFLMDGFIRIGFGIEPAMLESGLARIGALLDRL